MGYWFIPSANLTVTELSYNLHFFDIYIYMPIKMSAITYQKAKSEIGDINQLSSVGGEKLGILRDLFGRPHPWWSHHANSGSVRWFSMSFRCSMVFSMSFHVFPIFDGFCPRFPPKFFQDVSGHVSMAHRLARCASVGLGTCRVLQRW